MYKKQNYKKELIRVDDPVELLEHVEGCCLMSSALRVWYWLGRLSAACRMSWSWATVDSCRAGSVRLNCKFGFTTCSR